MVLTEYYWGGKPPSHRFDGPLPRLGYFRLQHSSAGVLCLNCPPPCPGDVNSDGVVDIDDVLIMLSGFGPC